MKVSYETMYNEFVRVLKKRGFTPEQSALSAKLYADASRDGVYTHGLNRFPKFINSIEHILRDKLSPYDTEEMLEAMRIFLEEQEGEQK